jgi:hypothetical protein
MEMYLPIRIMALPINLNRCPILGKRAKNRRYFLPGGDGFMDRSDLRWIIGEILMITTRPRNQITGGDRPDVSPWL